MRAQARAQAQSIGVLNNSIRKGAGNEVGCLGEQAFLHFFPTAVSHNTFQHDIVLDGITIECKTKDRTVIPKMSYSASVANANTSQRADYYAFMSVFRDTATDRYMSAYFCGFMEKEEYFKRAVFLNKGDYDESNGYYVKADCWNVLYEELER